MENKKYYKTLDLIRILSCVAVFLYHLNILKGGYLAVCVFFVLSGYLACNSAFRKDTFSLKEYYFNRLKHIYLPLLFVIFLSIFAVSFIKTNWLNLKPETVSVLLGYNNYWQIDANMDYFARHVDSPFMHFWYIAILLQFELVFPSIFLIFKKMGEKKKFIPIILLILLSIGSTIYFYISSINDSNIMNVYYNSLTRVFSIIFGITLGFIIHYYKSFIPFKNKIINTIIFSIYLVILILLCIFIKSDSNLFSYAMILTTLISCRLIDYSTIFISPLNKFDKVMKYISSISYEIYLFQYPVIFIFQYIVLKDYFKLPLIIIITIILSIILHFALDKKKNILKYILLIVITITSLFGVYKFIIEKDHTPELNKLKEELAKNEEEMKLKQKEYQEKVKREKEEYENKLKELENGSNNLEEVITNLSVVGVGDSVMLGAVNGLYRTFPNGYFDAKVSRTDYEANGILRGLLNQGMLSDTVVIHLGTNGQCGNRCRDVIMNTLGDRKVFWITVSNDYDVHVNSGLKEYSNNFSNSYIIDWEEASKGHPEYFAADKIHLNSSGIQAYCKLVYDSIYNVYKEEIEAKRQEMINNHNNELKTKITFYGNDLLLNVSKYMDYKDADYVIDKEFNYNKLVESIKKKKPNYNVVFVFDNSFKINNDQYKSIMNLLKDNKVYVVKVNNYLKYDNTEIIEFKDMNNYLMVDNVHLTGKGNEKLSELINKKIEIK